MRKNKNGISQKSKKIKKEEQLMKSERKTINFQTIFSLIALIISFFSVWYAKSTFDLTIEQQRDEKTAVWLSKLNKSEELLFVTNNENIAMQKANIYFPKSFNHSNREILFPEFKIPLDTFIIDLKDFLDARSKELRAVDYINVIDGNIPFVLESYYVVKGSGYSVKSIYHLRYVVAMEEEKMSFPSIEIKGFWFERHLEKNENSEETINEIWDEKSRITFGILDNN